MRFLLAILLLIGTITVTGQEVDSTQMAIVSYFNDGSGDLSKYLEKEIILETKGETYLSSFDEFDLFFRNVISAYDVQKWEFSHLDKDSYSVFGKSKDYIIIFKFERYDSNKIDNIFINKKKNRKLTE